jgi:DNA (cytosine-5)-methyltransferase 1
MKLGSLFDGIGGFPLAASIYGITPVWASEIEQFPIEVTKVRFPDMKHLGDITEVNGAEIEPVDIITAGSPCQDLSVAGKRAGLEGARSGLFMEFIRIVREMREATNGRSPNVVIWENVPGAFSSNGGQDFRAVLEEITEAEIPMPESGKWATAGLVRGNGRSVAWRVLDAQYFGVPQRRKRIFLVADLTGERAGQILFESEGVSGDLEESREQGQAAAGDTGEGVEGTEYLTGWDNQEKRIFTDRGVSPTLSGSDGGGGRTAVGYLACISSKQQSLNVSEDKANTLGSNDYKEPQCVCLNDQGGSSISVEQGDNAPTLRAETHGNLPCVAFQPGNIGRVAGAEPSEKVFPTLGATTLGDQFPHIAIENHPNDSRVKVDDSGTVQTLTQRMGTGGGNVPMVMAYNITQCDANGTRKDRPNGGLYVNETEKANTVTAKSPGIETAVATYQKITGPLMVNSHPGSYCGQDAYTDMFVTPKTQANYAVRRLTPLECERLQGFPDGWTDIEGASDTARYKALGNSVAVPCVAWIMKQIRVVW